MNAVLICTPDGETPYGRHWRRQEDNIKVDLEVKWCGDDWVSLDHDNIQYQAVADRVMNISVP